MRGIAYPQHLVEEVRRLHAEGWTKTAIAEKMKLHRTTVASWCLQGVHARRRKDYPGRGVFRKE